MRRHPASRPVNVPTRGVNSVVKGALAGSGILSAVTLIPDAWAFRKAFVKAYNSSGNERGHPIDQHRCKNSRSNRSRVVLWAGGTQRS